MINVTKHPIRFQNAAGEMYELPPSGVVIDARFEEEDMGYIGGKVKVVRVRIVPTPGSEEILARLEAEHPGEVFLGSLIAAQAFPMRVMALIAAEGFERVPADQKRMRDDKFTVF
jgi:hypothetical protein